MSDDRAEQTQSTNWPMIQIKWWLIVNQIIWFKDSRNSGVHEKLSKKLSNYKIGEIAYIWCQKISQIPNKIRKYPERMATLLVEESHSMKIIKWAPWWSHETVNWFLDEQIIGACWWSKMTVRNFNKGWLKFLDIEISVFRDE